LVISRRRSQINGWIWPLVGRTFEAPRKSFEQSVRDASARSFENNTGLNNLIKVPPDLGYIIHFR
jgi:hypothetical protein